MMHIWHHCLSPKCLSSWGLLTCHCREDSHSSNHTDDIRIEHAYCLSCRNVCSKLPGGIRNASIGLTEDARIEDKDGIVVPKESFYHVHLLCI